MYYKIDHRAESDVLVMIRYLIYAAYRLYAGIKTTPNTTNSMNKDTYALKC